MIDNDSEDQATGICCDQPAPQTDRSITRPERIERIKRDNGDLSDPVYLPLSFYPLIYHDRPDCMYIEQARKPGHTEKTRRQAQRANKAPCLKCVLDGPLYDRTDQRRSLRDMLRSQGRLD